MELHHGIRHNRGQFLHLLLQVLLVGLTLGMTRTVVPALAESDFGVPKNSFLLLSSFVVAFGLVKGVMNFVAGRLSERVGRKRVLLLGWVVALPIPVMVWYAPSWSWVVVATVLLGINQGLTWSMTQTAKLDITRLEERGLTLGLNEFAGYVGVALAGILTAYLATRFGARQGLMVFGTVVITSALLLTQLWVKDTLPWAKAEAAKHAPGSAQQLRPRYPTNVSANPSTWEIFTLMSWRDKRLMALSQAGLVEKFVDALVWVFYPVFLYQQGVSLTNVGWIIGVYGLVWGGSQLFTGRLSDRIGRHGLNIGGMWICGTGVAAMVLGDGVAWWAVAAGVSGLGMAMLYPNLSAAVADIAHPAWRGSAIGIYRFWRDLGYGIGALGLGLAAHFTGQMQAAFWFVAVSMLVSGGVLWWLGEETHPRLNPAKPLTTTA
ncbi:MFS transporter [Rhodoferax sp. AJA081-3]|uniref:MFS transporter n=1 Tax=Rhodoferax sp. AJA081-3 TaxID=2752316 RepID=UPI001ADED384|nr:MFS transporter [Rhodoferax sp. AJA081-3]QTN29396.1 MFS transporter [Rhodoferax sp. AJA081-3]